MQFVLINASISECTNPPTENVFFVKLLNSLNRQHTLLLQQHYPPSLFPHSHSSRSYMSSSEVALFGSLHSSVSLVGQNIYFHIIPENTETMSVLNPSPQQVIPVCNNLLHDFYLVFDPILIFPPWIFMTDIALI